MAVMLLMTKVSNEITFLDLVSIQIQFYDFKCRLFLGHPLLLTKSQDIQSFSPFTYPSVFPILPWNLIFIQTKLGLQKNATTRFHNLQRQALTQFIKLYQYII